jgi:hypothetical protein
MLLQPISLTNAVSELGIRNTFLPWRGAWWMLKAMRGFSANPIETVRKINALSPYMRTRMKSFDREVSDAIARHAKTHGWVRIKTADHDYTLKDVQDFGMTIYGAADAVGVYPAWFAAYSQALHKMTKGDARLTTEAQCVAYADDLVRQTMPGAQSVDLSTLQGGTGWTRLFTAFLTPQFRYGSRLQAYYRGWRRGKVSFKSFATHMVFEGLLPPLIYTTGSHLLTSGEPPEWYELVAAEIAWPVSWLPLIGQVISATAAQRGGGSISVPAVQVFERGARLYHAIFSGARAELEGRPAAKLWTQALLAGADLGDFALGIPLAARVETFLQGIEDLDRGQTENPFRLFIRASKEHKQ